MGISTTLLEQLHREYGLNDASGFVATYLDGVRFFWSTKPVARGPLLYESGVVIIGQGHKVVHVGSSSYRYDRDNYLVSSIPLSLQCETHASESEPLLGIFIDIDVGVLSDLVEECDLVGVHSAQHDGVAIAVGPVPMNQAMVESVERLLRCLLSPLDCRVIGGGLIKEVLFRALFSGHSASLLALTQVDTHFAKISRVVAYIHKHYNEPMSVDRIAEKAGMSSSSFHRIFKEITGETPLQYIKEIRLHKARELIIKMCMSPGEASRRVGYESSSQFSREFRRMFGRSPREFT